MSNTTVEKLKDLDFIIQDSIYLSGKKNVDLEKEIYNNFWQIMFSQDLMKDLSLFDLQEFVYNLFQKRSEQIKELNINSKATLYLWVDDMTRQLCFNIISGKDATLPFDCRLNILDSPDSILKRFLEAGKKVNENSNHLSLDDMKVVEPDDEDWDDEDWYNDTDQNSFVLDVYVTTIP